MALGALGNTIQILSAIFSAGGGNLHRQVIVEGPTGSLTMPVTCQVHCRRWPEEQGRRHYAGRGSRRVRHAQGADRVLFQFLSITDA